ncbi:MAG: thiamine-phosphate kinase [Xanthobacteraceae bacterium]
MAEEPTESGEDRLIAHYFKPLAKHPGAFGLVDDAAAIAPPPGFDIVLKTDAIIGGVHFFPDDPPRTIAQKALRVNLSDLAAKGAKPLGCLLSIGLPKGLPENWLTEFAAGLGEDIEQFGCPLFGGDTVLSPTAIIVSVSVIGTVPHGQMVRRAGAKVGDRVVVTGTIGDAALGLRLRQDKTVAPRWGLDNPSSEFLTRRYLVPEPRNAIADILRAHANAAMDISDGLAGDLGKLCRASNVSAEVDVADVPLSPAARVAVRKDAALIEPILTNGDDFEVLASIPAASLAAFTIAAQSVGVVVTSIGVFTAGENAPVFVQDGRVLNFARRSFSHF